MHSELQAVGYGNDSDKNKARVESHKYQQVGKHSCVFTPVKAKASQRWREEEGCPAVTTMQGSSSRLQGKISLDEAQLPQQVSVSRTLPSLLFSALFTLPQAFSNYHWPKSAGKVKDCLSLPVPRPGEPLGRYVSVKVIIGQGAVVWKCTGGQSRCLSLSQNHWICVHYLRGIM